MSTLTDILAEVRKQSADLHSIAELFAKNKQGYSLGSVVSTVLAAVSIAITCCLWVSSQLNSKAPESVVPELAKLTTKVETGFAELKGETRVTNTKLTALESTVSTKVGEVQTTLADLRDRLPPRETNKRK